MKRASSLVATAIVPVVVAFVLTARPARLYAESAPLPPACETLDLDSCKGKLANDPCGDGAPNYQCQPSYCRRVDDAGSWTYESGKIACRYVPPSPPASTSSSSGTSGLSLGVPVADGDGANGSGSGSGDDGGCSTSGADTGGRAWAAALGLFVMATAIKRRLRKA